MFTVTQTLCNDSDLYKTEAVVSKQTKNSNGFIIVCQQFW